MEIDPWADESDVDTNQALKRAIDNVVKAGQPFEPCCTSRGFGDLGSLQLDLEGIQV